MSKSKTAPRALMALWFIGTFALGAALVALHTPLALSAVDESKVAPPKSGSPQGSPSDLAQIAAPQSPDSAAGWNATHFIASGCGCSADVARHLLARGRISNLSREKVVFIGDPEFETDAFRKLGFETETVPVAEITQRHGISAAPLMHLNTPAGERAYAGGYYKTMARTEALDEGIIRLAMDGGKPVALPSWGCALGDDLRDAQDPLGIKSIK